MSTVSYTSVSTCSKCGKVSPMLFEGKTTCCAAPVVNKHGSAQLSPKGQNPEEWQASAVTALQGAQRILDWVSVAWGPVYCRTELDQVRAALVNAPKGA